MESDGDFPQVSRSESRSRQVWLAGWILELGTGQHEVGNPEPRAPALCKPKMAAPRYDNDTISMKLNKD